MGIITTVFDVWKPRLNGGWMIAKTFKTREEAEAYVAESDIEGLEVSEGQQLSVRLEWR